MQKIIFFLLFSSVIFFSCEKEEEMAIPNVGHSYAGLQVGKYVVYDVDSTFYNIPFGVDSTYNFQIKEVITSKYTDGEGEDAYQLIRYKKQIDSTAWVLQDVWNCKISGNNFEQVEENIRFRKMIFPVKANKTWNGNSMNTIESWDYEYTSVHQSGSIGGVALDSVTTVLQFDDGAILTQDIYYEERYAAKIGMVYKKVVDLEKNYNSSTGQFEISTGESYTMTVSTYGGI